MTTVTIERVLPDQPARIAYIRDYIIGYWRISPERADEYTTFSTGKGFPRAWVASTPDGSIIGCAMLTGAPEGLRPAPKTRPWLQALVVDEEWRKFKIGRCLVAAVEADCRRRGCRYLYLDTEDAEQYYLRLGGWRTIGTGVWEAKGVPMTIMRKRLDD